MRFSYLNFAGAILPFAMAAYDPNQAQISLMLSQVAYCGRDQYMTHNFTGVCKGFKVTYVIYAEKQEIEGFVGYLPSDKSIYVVLRGTSNIKNWETDLHATKEDYDDPACPDC